MTGIAGLALPFPQLSAGLGITTLLFAGAAWIQGQRMHSAKVELAALKGQIEQWKNDLATQKKSIDTLTAAIDTKNKEAQVRAKAFDAAIATDAKNVADANARAAAAKDRIKTLQDLAAKRQPDGVCKPSPELTNALEGL